MLRHNRAYFSSGKKCFPIPLRVVFGVLKSLFLQVLRRRNFIFSGFIGFFVPIYAKFARGFFVKLIFAAFSAENARFLAYFQHLSACS